MNAICNSMSRAADELINSTLKLKIRNLVQFFFFTSSFSLEIDFREKEVQFHYGKSLFDAGIINAPYKEGITKEYMFDEFESKINGYKTIIEIQVT